MISDNSLVLFNKALDSKEYFNKLKFRFELLLIIEKIVKETIYLSSPQLFLAEMLKFSKNLFPSNDFYFKFKDVELATGDQRDSSYIFKKEFEVSESENNFIVRVGGQKLNEHEIRLLKFILNHIYINIFLWDDSDKEEFDWKDNLSFLEENLIRIKEKANNILSLMSDESGGDNIYLFIKNLDRFEYLGDKNKSNLQFQQVDNINILNRLLSNSERIKNSVYELYDNEKHYYSALFSHKTNKLLLMPVRSQERLEAVILITNPIDLNDDLERVLELYKLYFEKLSIAFRKTLKFKKQFQQNTMNKIVAEIVETSSGDRYQQGVDLFFRHFNNYFLIKRMGIFFLDDNNSIKNWYKTANDIECPKNIFEKQESSGLIDNSKGEEFEYLLFIYDKKCRGCLLFQKEKNFDEENSDNLMQMSMLIFNILYSKEIYEKMKEIDRLAVLGGMAREMAHEIRNPLGGIRLYIEMLKKKQQKDVEIYENIEKGIYNIENVISDMLSFTRKETLNKTRCEFDKLILDSLKIVNISNEINISLKGIDDNNNTDMLCDKNKIASVLNNILINAKQSLDGIEKPEIRIIKDIQNNILELIIWNNGGEIKEEVRSRIFDPFFTTRKNGNGLGLSICKKIVNAHDGKIEVLSNNGWTGFKILLPYN